MKIKDILTICHGRDYKSLNSGKVPVLGTGGIITFVNKYLCNWNCVLIGRKGTINKPQYMSEPFWCVDTLFYSKPKENNYPKFQFYLFETIDWNKNNEASGVPSLSASTIGNIKVKIPSLNEQIKISTFLTKIDERIETQSKIIKDLEEQKKEISNILFLQPPIKKDALSNIYKKGKAGGTPKSTNKLYYGGEIPFLSISDMTEQGKYICKTKKYLTEMGVKNSSTWIVPTNSLILSMYASVGQVAINKIPITTSQAMFSMIVSENSVLNYLYYYLSYFKEKKLHRFLETGTQSNINADFVKIIEIPDYGKARNDLITSILSLFDEKIQIEKEIFELYKKQKAYLLQNMFI